MKQLFMMTCNFVICISFLTCNAKNPIFVVWKEKHNTFKVHMYNTHSGTERERETDREWPKKHYLSKLSSKVVCYFKFLCYLNSENTTQPLMHTISYALHNS